MRVQDVTHVQQLFGQQVTTLCGVFQADVKRLIRFHDVEATFGTTAADTLCPLCVPPNEPW